MENMALPPPSPSPIKQLKYFWKDEEEEGDSEEEEAATSLPFAGKQTMAQRKKSFVVPTLSPPKNPKNPRNLKNPKNPKNHKNPKNTNQMQPSR